MSLVPIKKIQKLNPETSTFYDVFAVPSVSIATPQGRLLVPNPAGKEAFLFETLAEAEEAVRRAGFDYEFEGKKTYVFNEPAPAGKTPLPLSLKPLEQAAPLLQQRLRDKEASVVASAAFALGAMRAYGAVEALADILGHDDPTVRKNVAEALARFGASALPRLRDAFEQSRSSHHKNAPYIRLSVISAFLEMLDVGIGGPLLDQFLHVAVQGLEDESWLVRAQAAMLIGRAAQVQEEEKARRPQ